MRVFGSGGGLHLKSLSAVDRAGDYFVPGVFCDRQSFTGDRRFIQGCALGQEDAINRNYFVAANDEHIANFDLGDTDAR